MKTSIFLKLSLILVAALATGLFLMSFGQKETAKVSVDTPYYYISDDMEEYDFKEIGHWTTDELTGDVGCETSGVRPCKVMVPAGFSLSDVLGNKTNLEVLDISINKKAAP